MKHSPAAVSKSVEELLEEAYKVRVRDISLSSRLVQEALDRSYANDDVVSIAKSLSMLSLFKMIQGDYETCMTLGEQAIGLFKVLKDNKGIADVKYNIAGVHYKTDNFHLGLIYLIDSLEIYQQLDDFHNIARVQKSLGTIYEYFGDEKSAMVAYQKAIDAAQKVNDLNLESNAYNPLSGIYLTQNNIEKATDLIERSVEMKKETGDIRGLAFALYGRAKVYVKLGDYALAESTFKESLAIHEEMGERLGKGMCYHKLGELYLIQEQYEKSKDMLFKALEFADTYNIVFIKFKCNFLLYQMYKDLSEPVLALKYLEIYLKEKEAVINTQTQKVIESYEAITKMERLQKESQMNREKAEILKKKNRAEESSRVKQEFLSTMSHEIRTPLNAVITITSLLKPHLNDEGSELLEALNFSSKNLLRIINDILDFNKLEVGKVSLETTSVNFSEMLNNIRNIYLPVANEKGLSLELILAESLAPYYELDETKMYQILGNLISNAIKYTNSGSVKIIVNCILRGDYRDQLEIRVEDTGNGIQEEFKAEIFESFSQPRSFTTRRDGGSGLGLAIVKKLIQLHGSNINVHTQEGEGSVFFFQLSLLKAHPELKQEEQSLEGLKDLHILLAEDNAINAMVLVKLLGNYGIQVDLAQDGQEAVTKCAHKAYDLILMDIHMPELDGFDAANSIKNTINPNQNTPIYALTADITASNFEQKPSPFTGFLLKPVEQDKLKKVLISI